MASWLDEAVKKRLESLPPKQFSPTVVFDFEHVVGAITIVEAAITAAHEETYAQSQASAHDAAVKAGVALANGERFSFIDEGVLTRMAAGLWTTQMIFPTILRRSLMIAVSAHIEHVLREWCRWLHREWSLDQALPKPKRGESDICNCMRYLREVAKLDIGDFTLWTEWSSIDGYRVLRNSLAHDGGIVTDEDAKRIETLVQIEIVEPGLLHDEETVVNLLPGACEAAAGIAAKFFARLTEIGARHPRAALLNR